MNQQKQKVSKKASDGSEEPFGVQVKDKSTLPM